MNALRAWFATRSLREKRLILVMLGLAALTLVWAVIIRPIGDALSTAREAQADAATRLGETRTEADTIRTVQALRSRPIDGPFPDAVRARADAAGFTLASFDAQAPDRVHLTIASARPGALVAWLSALEGSGILIDSANVTDNGDHTVAVDLVLKARGA